MIVSHTGIDSAQNSNILLLHSFSKNVLSTKTIVVIIKYTKEPLLDEIHLHRSFCYLVVSTRYKNNASSPRVIEVLVPNCVDVFP